MFAAEAVSYLDAGYIHFEKTQPCLQFRTVHFAVCYVTLLSIIQRIQ